MMVTFADRSAAASKNLSHLVLSGLLERERGPMPDAVPVGSYSYQNPFLVTLFWAVCAYLYWKDRTNKTKRISGSGLWTTVAEKQNALQRSRNGMVCISCSHHSYLHINISIYTQIHTRILSVCIYIYTCS